MTCGAEGIGDSIAGLHKQFEPVVTTCMNNHLPSSVLFTAMIAVYPFFIGSACSQLLQRI